MTLELLVELCYGMKYIKDVTWLIDIRKTVLSVVKNVQHQHILLAFNSNILESLKTFTSSKHLTELNALLLKLSNFEDLSAIIPDIEEQILELIRNTCNIWSNEYCKQLFATIHCRGLFREKESLFNILNVVCSTKKLYLIDISFPQLLSTENVSGLLQNDERLVDVCVTAVKFIFANLRNEKSASACQKEIERGYKYLNKIICSEVINNNERAIERIKEVAKLWLFKVDLKVATECSCQLPDDMTSNILIEQMQEYIHHELSKAGSANLNKKLHEFIGSKRLTLTKGFVYFICG